MVSSVSAERCSGLVASRLRDLSLFSSFSFKFVVFLVRIEIQDVTATQESFLCNEVSLFPLFSVKFYCTSICFCNGTIASSLPRLPCSALH